MGPDTCGLLLVQQHQFQHHISVSQKVKMPHSHTIVVISLVIVALTRLAPAQGYRIDPEYDLNIGAKCKNGYSPITSSWQDCKHAAEELGFSGDSVGYVDYDFSWGTDRPQGCFQSYENNRFHLNKGQGGNAKGTDKILCKKGGDSGSASTSDQDYSMLLKVYEQINGFRRSEGLSKIIRDRDLEKLAQSAGFLT